VERPSLSTKANNPLGRLIKQQEDAAICKKIGQRSPQAYECDLSTRSNCGCQAESESLTTSFENIALKLLLKHRAVTNGQKLARLPVVGSRDNGRGSTQV